MSIDIDAIGLDVASGLRMLRLIFEYDKGRSPAEAGMSGDTRRLSLFLQRISLVACDAI